MSEYVRQAQAFLKRCGATFSVKYVGAEKPKWDNEVHSTFEHHHNSSREFERSLLSEHSSQRFSYPRRAYSIPRNWYVPKR